MSLEFCLPQLHSAASLKKFVLLSPSPACAAIAFSFQSFSNLLRSLVERRMVRLLRDRRRISRKDDLMAEGINRDEVETLARNGAQVVEVLGAKEYEHAHIAGAINLPLAELNRERASVLNRDHMVILYCYDYQ